jgi:hypothetical protein
MDPGAVLGVRSVSAAKPASPGMELRLACKRRTSASVSPEVSPARRLGPPPAFCICDLEATRADRRGRCRAVHRSRSVVVDGGRPPDRGCAPSVWRTCSRIERFRRVWRTSRSRRQPRPSWGEVADPDRRISLWSPSSGFASVAAPIARPPPPCRRTAAFAIGAPVVSSLSAAVGCVVSCPVVPFFVPPTRRPQLE